MAIITENFKIGEIDFVRKYSDLGVKIHGDYPEGDYDEACYPAEFNRSFTETDIPIDSESEAEEIVDILTGVSE